MCCLLVGGAFNSVDLGVLWFELVALRVGLLV